MACELRRRVSGVAEKFGCTSNASGFSAYLGIRRTRRGPVLVAGSLSAWRTVILSLLVLLCTSAQADLIVTYAQTDLPDLVPGSDLRRYDYKLTGYTFNAGDSLSVYFGYGLYRDIHPVSGPPGWLIDAAEPDPLLGPGIFVAQSPAADDSPSFAFAVSLVWTGTGAPAEQTYQILGPEFNNIAGGITEATAVPEPAPIALLLAGIALVAVARRTRGR